MNKKPILFSGPMVQAILEGRKTVTRRTIKSKHESGIYRISNAGRDLNECGYYHGRIPESLDWDERTVGNIVCPYGRIGDIIWVRETWQQTYNDRSGKWEFIYRADGGTWSDDDGPVKWKPSIFMKEEACRIYLKITDIHVERLQDITEEQAKAEGAPYKNDSFTYDGEHCRGSYKNGFRSLWKDINGAESWEANPFVWAVSFERTEKPQ